MKSAMDVLKPRLEAVQANKAAREEAAKRNREAMPETAKAVEMFRECFGPGIKVLWATEGSRTVGKVPYDLVKDGL